MKACHSAVLHSTGFLPCTEVNHWKSSCQSWVDVTIFSISFQQYLLWFHQDKSSAVLVAMLGHAGNSVPWGHVVIFLTGLFKAYCHRTPHITNSKSACMVKGARTKIGTEQQEHWATLQANTWYHRITSSTPSSSPTPSSSSRIPSSSLPPTSSRKLLSRHPRTFHGCWGHYRPRKLS